MQRAFIRSPATRAIITQRARALSAAVPWGGRAHCSEQRLPLAIRGGLRAERRRRMAPFAQWAGERRALSTSPICAQRVARAQMGERSARGARRVRASPVD
jgi:hypothetical protein